jgi:hypothetical protein
MGRDSWLRNARLVTGLLLLFGVAACGEDEEGPGEPLPTPEVAYVGSETCGTCHQATYDEFVLSGHPYKLNKVENGVPPTYPFSSVPEPPAGYTWNDVTYVIGGFGWKARFIGSDGYIITQGGKNQYNLATQEWVDYHKDEQKPYDCGRCHTTGYTEEGNQDGLPGIVGQWALPGIQCEECHGPGSFHVENPSTFRMTVDTRAEACGRCHNRGGLNDTIPAKGGFIRHHEQYNELLASPHAALSCVTCHDPHTGVLYNDQEGAVAIKVACEDCHTSARQSILDGPLGSKKGDFDCETCHMPYVAKSAVTLRPYVGDVRSHLFRIDPDSLAEPFTPDGSYANHYVTTEFACLSCHGGKDKAWAAKNAGKIHGP